MPSSKFKLHTPLTADQWKDVILAVIDYLRTMNIYEPLVDGEKSHQKFHDKLRDKILKVHAKGKIALLEKEFRALVPIDLLLADKKMAAHVKSVAGILPDYRLNGVPYDRANPTHRKIDMSDRYSGNVVFEEVIEERVFTSREELEADRLTELKESSLLLLPSPNGKFFLSITRSGNVGFFMVTEVSLKYDVYRGGELVAGGSITILTLDGEVDGISMEWVNDWQISIAMPEGSVVRYQHYHIQVANYEWRIQYSYI